jgi:Protein of unknown function (DUF3592)
MELRRAFFLLLALSASILINLWWNYPFSDYGLGWNLSRTTGKIISAQMTRKEGSRSYRPLIEYQYNVNGASYGGTEVAIQPILARNKETINAIVARYAVGSTVSVYYSPMNPNFSLLDKSFPWGLLLETFLLIPGALIFSGVFLTLFSRS